MRYTLLFHAWRRNARKKSDGGGGGEGRELSGEEDERHREDERHQEDERHHDRFHRAGVEREAESPGTHGPVMHSISPHLGQHPRHYPQQQHLPRSPTHAGDAYHSPTETTGNCYLHRKLLFTEEIIMYQVTHTTPLWKRQRAVKEPTKPPSTC
jgi:hypothetical protein